MAEAARAVLVTGIGLVSCLGEGPDAHWQRLMQARPCADTTTFAPYVVHPLAPIELDRQIPKKGDQRQMEPWQRIGTFAAGLALDSAGAKGNAALLARMDLIVAAGGGERDYAVDAAILTGLQGAERPGVFLNERLMSDLRPTLFLAQLSNLLAGNISIVHGVTGSSRTFMGEEAAVSMPCASHTRVSKQVRAISCSSAAPITASAETCCCFTHRAGTPYRATSHPYGSDRRAAAGWRSARSVLSLCWKRASTPPRATPNPWPASRR